MRIHKNNKENEKKAAANHQHGSQEGLSITPQQLWLTATPDPKAPQETEEEKLAKQKKSRYKPEDHGWNMKQAEPKQYKRWNYNEYAQNQQASIQRKSNLEEQNEEEHSIAQYSTSAVGHASPHPHSNTLPHTTTPNFDSHKGQSIEKQGRISSPAKDFELVQSTGVRIRQKPRGDGEELGRLKYNTAVLVRALDQTGQWAFVIATDGKAGWLDKNYAAHPQPEPNAQLYHVKEGMAAQKDILSHYKNQGYSPEIGFDDKDIYKAVTIANQGRKGAGIDMEKYEESKNSWGNWLKDKIDGQGDKRATYQAMRFTAGTNIWLPSLSHVQQLRDDGIISKRADWLDAGIAAGKGVTAFTDGLVSGFLGGIWDTLSGLWDLGGEIISLVGKVVTGEIMGDIQNIYQFFKGLTAEKAKEIATLLLSTVMKALGDFTSNWNNGNFYDKWQFRGKVVGNILLELVLAIFTGGMGNAAKWLGKLGQVAPKLVAVFQKVVKSVDKAIPDKLKRKDRDADEKGEVTPEKQQALLAARLITEKHDAANSSIATLKASLLPIKTKYKSVKRFEVEQKKGQPGHYKVWMIASKLSVDEDYTPKPETDHDALKAKYKDWTQEEAEAYYKSMKGRDDIDMTAESPDHKAQRWQDYKERKGEWTYGRWAKQYHVNMSNARKIEREEFYKALLGSKGIKPEPLSTPLGNRHLDVQKKGTKELFEVKTGKEYRTESGKLPNIERIEKDKFLIENQNYEITWILEQGASGPLLIELEKAGIKYIIGKPDKL